MADNIFVDGMMFRKPKEGAPEWIKGQISVKFPEFITFAEEHAKNGWLNIDLKKSKEGKLYLALNTYKKTKADEDEDPGIPF